MALVAWLAFGGASPALADVDSCVDAAARELGARVARRETAFALPGRPTIHSHRYQEESCVAFLAVSRPRQDLDLRVLAPSGLELARDGASRAWAYASHCGVPGQEVHVSITSLTRGEFAFAVLEEAPPERPDLGRRVGACFAGEPGRAAESMGRVSRAPGDEVLATIVRRVARDQGWPEPRVRHGRLREGRGSVVLGVEAGQCHLVVVRSTDPAIYAEGRVANERWRTPSHRRAVLRGCPAVDAELEVQLDGRGDAAFAIGIATLPRPPDGPRSGAGAAALAVLTNGGGEPTPRVAARVHLRQGERLAIEHQPTAPCVTLAAIPASGDLADVRLRVVGGPADSNPDPESVVHVCEAGPLHLEVMAARGAGTLWLLERAP